MDRDCAAASGFRRCATDVELRAFGFRNVTDVVQRESEFRMDVIDVIHYPI